MTSSGRSRPIPSAGTALQLLGWIVIEVTWRRFVSDPESVIAEVLQAVAVTSVVSAPPASRRPGCDWRS